MNILYVGSFRLPNFDAAAPRVLNNARAMVQLGHCVKFISWGGAYREEDFCKGDKYSIDGMEYCITQELDCNGGFIEKVLTMLNRGKKSLSLIYNENPVPDLIILYNPDKNWTKKIMAYCNKSGCKLAVDITEWYDNTELHPWDIIPYRINMTETQKQVKNKILISTYLYKYYSGTNNVLIPPLCNPKEEKWSKKIADDRVATFDGITLIYAGNPAKKDLVHTVINVVNSLAYDNCAIRFLILGITREQYIERYLSLLEMEDLHPNIVFLGRVSQDLIPAYYKLADFMVLLREPSRKNNAGFPTKFAEAMTAGVPVITNRTSDLNLYIINGETGFLLESCDAKSLKNKLIQDILPLTHKDIQQMHIRVKDQNFFDYRIYSHSIQTFLSNLQ